MKQSIHIHVHDQPQFRVGTMVSSSEHPGEVGEVTRITPNGDLIIEWRTPPSRTMPFGQKNSEVWRQSEFNLLKVVR